MTPIIKIVGDACNLRCRYCFYNANNQTTLHIMDMKLLERFIGEYMALFNGCLTFIWHGGEPLLAGLPFFESIIRFQQQNIRTGHVIYNVVQTNATLVNNDWAEFFKLHDFRVGVSLDGTKESHNRFRTYNNGNGSFDDVMKGLEILRHYGIDPGVIQTLTHDNCSRATDDFNFFVSAGLGWGINTYLDGDASNPSMSDQNISNEELVSVIKTHIDLWLDQDISNLRIREIEDFIAGVLGKQAAGCTFNGTCTAYFLVEYNGEIYPCDRLSHQKDLLFGDIRYQSLQEILNGSVRLSYAQAVNTLHSDCETCDWQYACHNGCTHHRVGGIGSKYYYCEVRKAIFTYLSNKVDQALQH
ncbi:radical SAM protein [Patescibacteria group bacterium]|nr:radical SAM protein [Patescibacteria group bacterium]